MPSSIYCPTKRNLTPAKGRPGGNRWVGLSGWPNFFMDTWPFYRRIASRGARRSCELGLIVFYFLERNVARHRFSLSPLKTPWKIYRSINA
ncbi:hypothetical protein GQ53DRAFT_178312 [Thozetella sp. PMI_491]|nr:hypothetical protein GQ53DRAFT_178312 [Thozetella sp. PMI_491]